MAALFLCLLSQKITLRHQRSNDIRLVFKLRPIGGCIVGQTQDLLWTTMSDRPRKQDTKQTILTSSLSLGLTSGLSSLDKPSSSRRLTMVARSASVMGSGDSESSSGMYPVPAGSVCTGHDVRLYVASSRAVNSGGGSVDMTTK
jgi:hypothetical protein